MTPHATLESTKTRRIPAAMAAAGATLVFLVLAGGALLLSIRATGGRHVYPLDDTYILLSMARNLAFHGTWGIAPGQYTSCSSTPLFLIVNAAVARVLPWLHAVPLILNVIFGVALLWVAAAFLRSFGRGNWTIFFALTALVFAMPLPLMVLSGMEHVLQTLLGLVFVWVALDYRSDNPLLPGALAALVVGVRFEGMALAGLGALVLWFRGRRLPAVAACAGGAMPVALYAWMNLRHGWPLLPASMLAKVSSPRIVDLIGYRALGQMEQMPILFGMMLLLCVIFIARTRDGWRGSREQWLPALVVGLVMAHLNFGNVGWTMRYEAYLVALCLIAAFATFPWSLGDRPRSLAASGAVAAIALLLAAPMVDRGRIGMATAVNAPHNIHDQQIQMARFVARHYDHSVVGINDIGALSYYTRAKLIDYTGLANLEALTTRPRNLPFFINRGEDAERLFAHTGVQIAVVYDRWLTGIPSNWILAGRWDTFNYRSLLGDGLVSFYARRPEDAAVLAQRLREFSAELPPGVYRPR